MSFSLTIRAAVLEDEASIIALWRACDLVKSYNDPHKDFHFAYNKANSDVLIGVDSAGHIISSVMVGHDGHRGWIYYLAVDKISRQQGLGSNMIEAAEKWLLKRDVPKVMLMVRHTNVQVVDFYKHLGFEEAPSVVLQKWLKPIK